MLAVTIQNTLNVEHLLIGVRELKDDNEKGLQHARPSSKIIDTKYHEQVPTLVLPIQMEIKRY